MSRRSRALAPGLAALAALVACAPGPAPDAGAPDLSAPRYMGVETRLLEGDLVNFMVRADAQATRAQVASYAECAAAQYALIRGYGFARHVRTNVYEEGGIWRGDAVYTISPALPEGFRTIDAEVTVANCRETGIPTV